MRILSLALSLLLFAACGSKSNNPDPETPAPTGDPAPADPAAADRPSITAAECESQGGEVVGDIGDGAVHRADYVCASGTPPVGKIATGEGEPQPIEGSVCCKKQ